MTKRFFLFTAMLILGLGMLVSPAHAEEQVIDDAYENLSLQQDEFYRGIIIDDPTETQIEEYGQTVTSQQLKIRITSGPEKGTELELPFTIIEGTPGNSRLEKNDRIIVGKSFTPDDAVYFVSDIYRLHTLWWLLGLFFALVLLLARWAGVRAIVGLCISFVVIIMFIVPGILDGHNAVLVAFIGALVVATVSLFIAHGVRSRTAIACISTIITISIALLLALFFTNMMHLFGLGSEEAFYLQTTPEQLFNLRGILLAGIIIGTLGVLDDITTAQAAVVEELHLANPELSKRELFVRASSVGREHIISLVNTLVLAYTGAALPLLLLFRVYERPSWLVVNSEIVMEELVRMIIGSIALVIAVPLTTALAASFYAGRPVTQQQKNQQRHGHHH